MSNSNIEVDEYLAVLSDEKSKALSEIRALVRSLAPEAVECISYQIPMFKWNGMLVGFASYPNHCSFTVANTTTLKMFSDELKTFKWSPSTIQFTPDKPIPTALLKKIIMQRIMENKERADQKANKGKVSE